MLDRIKIPTVHDQRGNLSFLESGTSVPFDIKRVYYLHDVPHGSERGGHAHRRLNQIIIALSGSFVVRTHDGERWNDEVMTDPTEGLIVPTMMWRELVRFSSGSVCLVLASEYFDESDYLRDFDDFLAEVGP